MSKMSDTLESGLLGELFQNITYNLPHANIYIALATGTLQDSYGGNLGNNEVLNAGGYARQSVTRGIAGWSFTANSSSGGNVSGEMANAATITFGPDTSGWGTITHVGIMDSGVYGAGTMLLHGPLAVSKTLTTGDSFQFSAGNLKVFFG